MNNNGVISNSALPEFMFLDTMLTPDMEGRELALHLPTMSVVEFLECVPPKYSECPQFHFILKDDDGSPIPMNVLLHRSLLNPGSEQLIVWQLVLVPAARWYGGLYIDSHPQP